jgi:hypothetical protein
VSKISSIIYEIYHLQLHIINQWNHLLKFIQSFIAVDYNIQNSQVLLDKLILKNFKINICNNFDSWKFEQKSHVIEIFTHHFAQELDFITHVFEVWTAYRFCLDSDNETDFWEDDYNSSDNLTNMFKKLHIKYHNFFNIWKAE